MDLDAAGPVPPRAPGTHLLLRWGRRPSRRDAAAMRSTVSMAVPDGASTLRSWCSSMTSADSNQGAASSANRIISTAPMAKLGATRQLLRVKAPAGARESSAVKPVVPTTACTPCSAAHARLRAGGVEHREVDHHLEPRRRAARPGRGRCAGRGRRRRWRGAGRAPRGAGRWRRPARGRGRPPPPGTPCCPCGPPAPNTPTRTVMAGEPTGHHPGRPADGWVIATVPAEADRWPQGSPAM